MTTEAQQIEKVCRIGYLHTAPAGARNLRLDVFRDELRSLGYVEGQNIALEIRSAPGRRERYPRVAADLIRAGVDVIVTSTGLLALAVKGVTDTVPIISGPRSGTCQQEPDTAFRSLDSGLLCPSVDGYGSASA